MKSRAAALCVFSCTCLLLLAPLLLLLLHDGGSCSSKPDYLQIESKLGEILARVPLATAAPRGAALVNLIQRRIEHSDVAEGEFNLFLRSQGVVHRTLRELVC